MRGERLEVSVTFDSARVYIASAPELRAPVVALSFERLAQAPLLLPGDPVIVLQLDGTAERRALASMDGKMAELTKIATATTLVSALPTTTSRLLDPATCGGRCTDGRCADARAGIGQRQL
jgi:hypothetical protein